MTDETRNEVGRLPGRVERRVRDAPDSLPGERDALPPGTLPGPDTNPTGTKSRAGAVARRRRPERSPDTAARFRGRRSCSGL